jgi:hypothetical protein
MVEYKNKKRKKKFKVRRFCTGMLLFCVACGNVIIVPVLPINSSVYNRKPQGKISQIKFHGV